MSTTEKLDMKIHFLKMNLQDMTSAMIPSSSSSSSAPTPEPIDNAVNKSLKKAVEMQDLIESTHSQLQTYLRLLTEITAVEVKLSQSLQEHGYAESDPELSSALRDLSAVLQKNSSLTNTTRRPPLKAALHLLNTFVTKILSDTRSSEKRYRNAAKSIQYFTHKESTIRVPEPLQMTDSTAVTPPQSPVREKSADKWWNVIKSNTSPEQRTAELQKAQASTVQARHELEKAEQELIEKVNLMEMKKLVDVTQSFSKITQSYQKFYLDCIDGEASSSSSA